MGVSDLSAAKTQCSTPEGFGRVWRVDSPARLEIFLQNCLPDASRESLRRALAAGACRVDGVVRPTGFRVTVGAEVRLDDGVRITEVVAESMPLEVLYEDEELIAVNKPWGMLVHPTTHQRTGTLVNGLRGAGHRQVHILHRLDRETSGVLVAAKKIVPGSMFARMFEAREVEKLYLAVTAAPVAWEERTVLLPVGRDPLRQPQWDVSADGAPSETRLRVVARSAEWVLLEARPVTGRTNQIRIHCAAIGHPLRGDGKYGGPAAARLALHAWKLKIPTPAGGRLSITAPVPKEFAGPGAPLVPEGL